MDTKNDVEIAFVNALKALDADKEYEFEQMYQKALRDIAETVLDMRFDENNEPIVEPNEEYNG